MKYITDYFYNFDSMDAVYGVANILINDWGLEDYCGNEFRGKDLLGRYTSKMELFDGDKVSFLASKGLDYKELVEYFDDMIKRCYVVCENNKRSFADVLCEATEYWRQQSKLIFDDDTEECNRQFRSMMDDNDAWGNIE